MSFGIWISACALAGAIAGAITGVLDGIWVLVLYRTAASLLPSVGAGIIFGLAAGTLSGLAVFIYADDDSVDDVYLWPARLLAAAFVSIGLAFPAAFIVYIPLTRFVSLRYQLLAVTLTVIVVNLLAYPLTDRVFGWISKNLKHLPRESSPKQAREHLLWALLLVCFPLSGMTVLWGWLGIHEAIGWFYAVAIDVFVFTWLLSGYWLSRVYSRRRDRVGRILFPWLGTIAILGIESLLLPLLNGERAQRVLATATLPTIPIYVVRSLWDRDGDGYSPFFGGGDCNDNDPNVKPFALDLPGNGIDEDCSGKDAKELPISHRADTFELSSWPKQRRRPQNIVFLTAEAFRSDALKLAGESAVNIRSFAKEATYFNRAYAPGPATHLSFASLFTGRYPSRLRWNLKKRPIQVVSTFRSFVTQLRRQGYDTRADVTCWIQRRFRVVSKGFSEFDCGVDKTHLLPLFEEPGTAESAALTKPFFVWIHFDEPHGPHGSGTPTQLKKAYAKEIRDLDRALGPILKALRNRSDWDRTVVVLTGDHAEGLGEHGVTTHGVTIYDSEVHIPLWIRVPGFKPVVRDDLVSLVDLGPTFLDLLGIRWRQKFDGVSLLPALLGRPLKPRVLFVELYNGVVPPTKWLALYFDNYKLLRKFHDARDELYDLAKDPDETKDLISRGISIGELLRHEASRFAASISWLND